MDIFNQQPILIVNDALHTGGKERRMLELIKGLLERGFKVVLVLLSDVVEYDYVYNLPLELIIIKRKSKFELATFRKLKEIIIQYKPAIIHSWGYVPSVYLGPLSKILKVKFINGVIADAIQNLTIRNKFYLMAKVSFPFSDKILANSQAGILAYRPPLHKAQCIYNGIDLNRFKNLREKNSVIKEIVGTDLTGDYKIAGMVAAFEGRKDYDTLVKAAIAICNKYENAYFILVGGGSKLNHIKSQIPDHLLSKIILTGNRTDVESIVNVFDVGILLTNLSVHGEGISNTIIEYMALQKPVIATKGGGTDEIMENGKNGFLIDPYNPKQLEDKLEELFNSEKLCSELGANGRVLIENKFSLETMTSAFIDLYKKLILTT